MLPKTNRKGDQMLLVHKSKPTRMLLEGRMMLAIAAIVIALSFGCAHSPLRLSMMSAEALKEEPTISLAKAYGYGKNKDIRAELERRKVFSKREWKAIDEEKIFRGMSTAALYASWGQPYRTNRSVGSWGVHTQHIFRNYCGEYVYTKNGLVSSWQY